MAKSFIIKFFLIAIIFPCYVFGQDWNLKLKSKVEASNWKLSSKAYKQEIFLENASVELLGTSGSISKTTSDKDGNFEIDLPANGNYTLMITCPGYNPKKFSLNTSSIPIKNSQGNFIPSVDMTGFIGSKEIKGVGDLGLHQPMVKPLGKNQQILYGGLNFSVNMNDAEYRVIQKFCICNKLGDMAMENKNYALAKTYYMMATDIISTEAYSKDQLKKAEDGIKMEKFAEKNVARKGKAGSKGVTPVIHQKSNNTAQFKNTSTGGSGHKVRQTLGGKK